MNETQYRCFYIMDGKIGPLDTIIPDIAAVKDGFWVNRKFEYTTGSDCLYWLPPASILYVRKEPKEVYTQEQLDEAERRGQTLAKELRVE